MNQTNVGILPARPAMKPCYLALSSDVLLGSGAAAHTTSRRWRILSIDSRTELHAGKLVTNADDPLAIVRDKAQALAREQGYEPQSYILES
jgi:hypothetical protein